MKATDENCRPVLRFGSLRRSTAAKASDLPTGRRSRFKEGLTAILCSGSFPKQPVERGLLSRAAHPKAALLCELGSMRSSRQAGPCAGVLVRIQATPRAKFRFHLPFSFRPAAAATAA